MVKVEDLKYDFLEFPLEMDSFYKDSDVIKYLEEIKKYKQLTKEEEKDLLDKKQYKEVFHSNLMNVLTIASRYSLLTKSIYPMDLIQEANIGLLEAIKKFDSSIVSDFSNYMRLIVNKKLTKMLKNEGKMFNISEDDFEKLTNYVKTIELKETIEDPDKHNELLHFLRGEFDYNYYKNYLMYYNDSKLESARKNVISLETINKEQELGTYDIEDDIDFIHDKMLLKKVIKELNLSDNEKKVLYYLYFSKKRYLEKDLAQMLNLSTSRINQMKKRLLLKIKWQFEIESNKDIKLKGKNK